MYQYTELLNAYRTLSTYCDRFWHDVFTKLPDQCACAAGCSACCELRTVTLLEAFVIARWSTENGVKADLRTAETDTCPFLAEARCSIYPSRPLICRTHGLLLRSSEFSEGIAVSCPLNFASKDPDAIPESAALDIDRVTDNLVRLNLAFCTLLGDRGRAGERISLADLSEGRIDSSWFLDDLSGHRDS